MPEYISIVRKYIFICPLIAGLCLCLFFSLFVNYDYDPLNPNDQGLHQRIATNLARDFTFSSATGQIKPFSSVRPPLYPLLLAIIMKAAGTSWLYAVRAVQIIFHLASIWLVWKIALRLYEGSRYHAFIASMTAALIPHTAIMTHDILSEPLAILLLTACVYLTLKAQSMPSYKNYIFLGICAGLLILTRPVFLLLFPLLWLFLIVRSPDKKAVFIRIILSAISVTVVMLPWMYVSKRELHQTRTFQNTGVGFNLMLGIYRTYPFFGKEIRKAARDFETDGTVKELSVRAIQTKYLGPGSRDIDTSTEEVRRLIAVSFMVYAEAWRVNPPEPELVTVADNFLSVASVAWISAHPRQYLSLLSAHLKALIIERYHPDVYQDLEGRAFKTSDYFKYILYLLFLTGVVSGIKRGSVAPATLPLIVIIYLLAIHLPMNTWPRYFMPAYPFMALIVPMLIIHAGPKKIP